MVAADAFEPAFWQGRRVFLTGHTGFKGAWLSLWLARLGAQVFGFSKDVPTARSLFEDAGLPAIVADARGDVRDYDALRAAMAAAEPDIVLHLAAQSLVRASYDRPVETYATNLMGTVHVLEAARSIAGGCPVLVVTTDKCYENREWIWGYRESEAMGGHDPYSSSKGCAELASSAYVRSFAGRHGGFTAATARAGNVIGGGDWAADRLIPDLVRGYEDDRQVAIRYPDAVRPWQHVLEPLGGYLLLARLLLERPDAVAGQGWNFGPLAEADETVRFVADRVSALLGPPSRWVSAAVPGQPHEARSLRLDITKARTLLGWEPRWTLPRALAESVHLYRERCRGAELRARLERQIMSYEERSSGSAGP